MQSPTDVQVGDVVIPGMNTAEDPGYRMRIRYVPADMQAIPRVSVAGLEADPSIAAPPAP